jgi:N-acetylneuraminic acid mutarotase
MDVWGDKMLIFGGFVEGYRTNEIHLYDFKSRKWEPHTWTGISPEPRAGHTGTVYKDCLYVFGGKDDDNNKLHDLWQFDLNKKVWKEIKAEKPPLVNKAI